LSKKYERRTDALEWAAIAVKWQSRHNICIYRPRPHDWCTDKRRQHHVNSFWDVTLCWCLLTFQKDRGAFIFKGWVTHQAVLPHPWPPWTWRQYILWNVQEHSNTSQNCWMCNIGVETSNLKQIPCCFHTWFIWQTFTLWYEWTIIILPVALYGWENWSFTLKEESRLRVFENRVLRRMFGPKRIWGNRGVEKTT
jgi:hypothetical protein